MPLLLDTCAAIWTAEDELDENAVDLIGDAVTKDELIHVSAITAWEIGLLVARGRITSSLHPLAWFRQFTAASEIAVVDLSPEILVASSFLPDCPLKDPADRIIVASARENAFTIMTRDRAILTYADAGHVRAVRC
ncbi:type II toxin-antitoxin system VapC family toxin [Acuticoccus yangtzensis]|uniref:type II toxin-antitoxin system VapC family toxin n=1 Tax=Acuticoccus yangtzensis TaxID=1443441 RepID=UPI0009495BB0|nr:type II toxin-antitoxin system VapC family toxin [Acuticoccus yangtzensis]